MDLLRLPEVPLELIMDYLEPKIVKRLSCTCRAWSQYIDQNCRRIWKRKIHCVRLKPPTEPFVQWKGSIYGRIRCVVEVVEDSETSDENIKKFYVEENAVDKPVGIVGPNLNFGLPIPDADPNVSLVETPLLLWLAETFWNTNIEEITMSGISFDETEYEQMDMFYRNHTRATRMQMEKCFRGNGCPIALLRFASNVELSELDIDFSGSGPELMTDNGEILKMLPNLDSFKIAGRVDALQEVPESFHSYPPTFLLEMGMFVSVGSLRKAFFAWWFNELEILEWIFAVSGILDDAMSLKAAIGLNTDYDNKNEIYYTNPCGKRVHLQMVSSETNKIPLWSAVPLAEEPDPSNSPRADALLFPNHEYKWIFKEYTH